MTDGERITMQLGNAATKWQNRTAVASTDFLVGVQQPRRSWEARTTAAASTFQTAVSNPAIKTKFEQGVKRAGTQRWQARAAQVGPARYVEGTAAAVDRWQGGFKPFADALCALTLPPRGPRGATQNLQRVQAVATALNQVRLQRP